MSTQLYRINNFTGKMVKDNPEGASPQDCADLLNVLPVNGILALKRDYMNVFLRDTENIYPVSSGLHAVGYWQTFSGQYAFPFAYGTDGVSGSLGFLSGLSVSALTVSMGCQSLDDGIDSPSGISAFIPFKNIVRVGGSYNNLPAMLAYTPDIERFNASVSGFTVSEGFKVITEYATAPNNCPALGMVELTSSPGHNGVDMMIVGSVSTSDDYLFMAGDFVLYGVSFVYDGNQETPVTMIAPEDGPTLTQDNINLTVFVKVASTLNIRVTDINLYRYIATNKRPVKDEISPYDIKLFRTISAANGAVDDTGSAKQWYKSGSDYIIELCDYGNFMFDDYANRTGYLQFNIDMSGGDIVNAAINPNIYYNFGAIIKGRNVVNTLKYYEDGNWIAANRTMYISELGKPDMFIPGNKIVLGERSASPFTCIFEITSDYFAVCDAACIYVINCADISPLNWYYTTTFDLSLISSSSIYKANAGVFIACRQGIYIISPSIELTELTKSIHDYWVDTVYASVVSGGINTILLYYDDETGLLYAFGKDATTALVLDLKNGASCRVGAKTENPNGKNFSIFKGGDGNIYMVGRNTYLIYFYEIIDTASSIMDTLIRTIPIGLAGSEGLKFGKYLHINYGSSASVDVDVYLDHSVSPTTLGELPANTAPTQYRLPMPYKFRQCEVEIKSVSNTGEFELHSIGLELKQGRPE